MNASNLPKLDVVVLAAGLSSRLGRPKALVKAGPNSLLRRTLMLVAGLASGRVILVMPPRNSRYRFEARDFKVTAVANPERALGLSTSVRRGLHAARFSSGVLLLPVDLAVLCARDLRRLHQRWRGGRRRLVARALRDPGKSGLSAGIPLILPRRLYSRALELSGDVGLRQVIAELPPEDIMLVDLPSAELDIDTAEDVEVLRRCWRRSRTV